MSVDDWHNKHSDQCQYSVCQTAIVLANTLNIELFFKKKQRTLVNTAFGYIVVINCIRNQVELRDLRSSLNTTLILRHDRDWGRMPGSVAAL